MKESRLIPFCVAGIICFGLSFFLGAGFWYYLGSNPRTLGSVNNLQVQTSTNNLAPSPEPAISPSVNINSNSEAAPTPTPEAAKMKINTVSVTGGEVILGGGATKLPVRRVSVADFSIAETEVTNAQYLEFIEAAKHPAPAKWKNGKFADGDADKPVVGVTWADANAYCQWLSKQIGAEARLPNEAEWERAARGETENIYPWGNEWNVEAAQSREDKGKMVAVKTYDVGKSPSGAYEMIGNVWEWTSDLAVDEFGKPILFEKINQRIIKGGSYSEERKLLTIAARVPRPETRASDLLGFRYVVVK